MRAMRVREAITGYLFIAPTLVSFLVFTAGALIAGLGLSFYRFEFFSSPEFIGLTNFRLLLADTRIAAIFGNTVYFSIGILVLNLACALALAVALNSHMPGALKQIFRVGFFFPVLTSTAVMAIIWRYLLNTDLGIINWFLGQFGVPKIPWLISSQWVRPAIILAAVWNGVGFNMVLLLAGMQGIPRPLYEAAEIDGAGRVESFRYVTLPLLTPTVFFILVRDFISVLQFFNTPYNLSAGGPGDASRTIVMYIYETGFRSLRQGYASAIALLLFTAILTVTIIQVVVSRRWVFYR